MIKKTKNKFKCILIICLVLVATSIGYNANAVKVNTNNAAESWSSLAITDQNSVLQNSLFYMLSPYIDKQIQNYYNDKNVRYTFEKIESVNAHDGYKLTISFSTFKGPHIFIGNDRIIVKIEPDTVTILEFTHNPR